MDGWMGGVPPSCWQFTHPCYTPAGITKLLIIEATAEPISAESLWVNERLVMHRRSTTVPCFEAEDQLVSRSVHG